MGVSENETIKNPRNNKNAS